MIMVNLLHTPAPQDIRTLEVNLNLLKVQNFFTFYISSTVKTCTPPATVDYSTMSQQKNSYDYGESITYTCTKGYENTGGLLTRLCTNTNTWSGEVPVCTSKLDLLSVLRNISLISKRISCLIYIPKIHPCHLSLGYKSFLKVQNF